jgi:hypothetical protein
VVGHNGPGSQQPNPAISKELIGWCRETSKSLSPQTEPAEIKMAAATNELRIEDNQRMHGLKIAFAIL